MQNKPVYSSSFGAESKHFLGQTIIQQPVSVSAYLKHFTVINSNMCKNKIKKYWSFLSSLSPDRTNCHKFREFQHSFPDIAMFSNHLNFAANLSKSSHFKQVLSCCTHLQNLVYAEKKQVDQVFIYLKSFTIDYMVITSPCSVQENFQSFLTNLKVYIIVRV